MRWLSVTSRRHAAARSETTIDDGDAASRGAARPDLSRPAAGPAARDGRRRARAHRAARGDAAFISDRLWAGASLIVSDQGISNETGNYTDFIVLTR